VKLFLLGSIAFDEIGKFRGHFKDVIRPELMEKLTISFVVDESQRYFGGCSGNVAYGLGLLKVPAALCSRIGQDGAAYKQAFVNWGMNVDSLDMAEEGHTAHAVITTDEDGAQIAHFAAGVLGSKAPAFVLPEVAEKNDILLVGPENHDRMLQALKQGSAKGLSVFFDPGQLIHSFNREELVGALKEVVALLVNEYEWELLQSLSGMEETAITQQVPLVWITRGEKGATLYEQGVAQNFEAFPAVVKDPTGAGDAFRAGILAGLSKNLSVQQSTEIGLILGAASVEHALAQGYEFSSLQAAALKKLGFE